MGYWKLIVPQATRGYVLNPSAEIGGNFAAAGAATVTRVTTSAHYGLYSYRVQSAGDNQGMTLTLSALPNEDVYVTMRVAGSLPPAWDWSLDGVNFHTPALIEDIDGIWSLYGLAFDSSEANGSTTLTIHQAGAGSGDYRLDGIQIEAGTTWTTYCDGSQPGCRWRGPDHAATSERSAASAAGGRVYDIQDDYHLDVGGMLGAGAGPQRIAATEYAILPGGEHQRTKELSRSFTLTGVVRGDSLAELHSHMQTLIDAIANGPVTLRYTGAAVQKQITTHYESGMEGALVAGDGPCFWQRMAIRFFAPQPRWREIGESAAELDTNDSAEFQLVAARLASTGQWDNLGPPAYPGAGPWTYVRAIAIAPDGTIYIGGWFENMDNDPAMDHIARYDPRTGVWSPLGAGLNGIVYDLAFLPDGRLVIAGDFTNAGGDANADYVCLWDGAAFSALNATPLNNFPEALIVLPDGRLVIGGWFTNAGGDANADYVCQWGGAAFSALNATPLNNAVLDFALGAGNTLYLAGGFTNAAGDASADYVCAYDWPAGGAFTALTTTPLNAFVHALAVSPSGELFIGGTFTNAGGPAGDYVCRYNGTAFFPMGTGANNLVYTLAAAADGSIYAGGLFTQMGGLALADRFARWNGSTWVHTDLDLIGAATVRAIAFGAPDPVVSNKYDIWIGHDLGGIAATSNYGGKVTVTNDGTAAAYPKIVISRSGGTSATLATLRNETTGLELLFNYNLLDGETLTIDLSPTNKSIISSFFGLRMKAVLANSDFGQWALEPGDNDITCFVNVAGAPTITAYVLWQDQYVSQD